VRKEKETERVSEWENQNQARGPGKCHRERFRRKDLGHKYVTRTFAAALTLPWRAEAVFARSARPLNSTIMIMIGCRSSPAAAPCYTLLSFSPCVRVVYVYAASERRSVWRYFFPRYIYIYISSRWGPACSSYRSRYWRYIIHRAATAILTIIRVYIYYIYSVLPPLPDIFSINNK